nr:ABC transporter ATP-binding protein [Nitrosomonas nitrosa]
MLLEISGLTCHYGRTKALKGIDLAVREGELVALVGANGAGKTTLLRAISGVLSASAGRIQFRGQDITQVGAHRRVRLGISQVPEGRQLFGPMTVEENLELGAYTQRSRQPKNLHEMFEVFPVLKEKRGQAAGTLSGGQQQMAAIARALMAEPKLLLLDEPSMGLAPLIVKEIFAGIARLRAAGTTILLVEQNAHAALRIADRGYVMETGNIVMTETARSLLGSEHVRRAYLGA